MVYLLEDESLGGYISLTINEQSIINYNSSSLLTIIWNRGEKQTVTVDEVTYQLPQNAIIPLMANQKYNITNVENLVVWQFNREFYCIVDHDKEVSCSGILFYSAGDMRILQPEKEEINKLELLLNVFVEEYETKDNIQAEMLRMLLKRLIIKLTRITKLQYLPQNNGLNDNDLNIVRQYNLLVETKFRDYHKVKDYADMLHKSPKTLSNLFALYNNKSPLQIIHDRITLEAKRLLRYTDKSAKEVAYDLGFDEAPHFSRFFKKETGQSPSQFKQNKTNTSIGKN